MKKTIKRKPMPKKENCREDFVVARDYKVDAPKGILPIHLNVINKMNDLGFTLFDIFVNSNSSDSYILVFHRSAARK